MQDKQQSVELVNFKYEHTDLNVDQQTSEGYYQVVEPVYPEEPETNDPSQPDKYMYISGGDGYNAFYEYGYQNNRTN